MANTSQENVHSSNCHPDPLVLEVVTNQLHCGSEPQWTTSQGHEQLVQEVVRLAETAQQQAAQMLKLSRQEGNFLQSQTPNLEEIRDLALMDLETLPKATKQMVLKVTDP